jgi:hypothetical protein
MKLRRLSIKNYRGIKQLDWIITADVICLVGPGDSTKTTVLDAIGHVLSSRFSVTFSDADFFGCDITNPIVIEAVVTDLPDELVKEQSLGLHRSGIRSDGSLESNPLDEPGVDECLIVRLRVDATLEPLWEVIRPDEQEGVRITASQRARLGFFRIGDFADTHLKWSRGSALSSLTVSKSHAESAVLQAQRKAREAVKDLSGTPLHDAAAIVQADAIKLGSAHFQDLRPGLDPGLSGSASSLVLHDGDVPLANYGLGSRRLTSLAIQEKALDGRSIVAIDEVEQGLEPHRLTHLMRYLISKAADQDLQVLMTTHSPAVIEGLTTEQLFIVVSNEGVTVINQAAAMLPEKEGEAAQGLMRSLPSAFLARQIIVGEGATEAGFLRQLLTTWDGERESPTSPTAVTTGTTVVNGGGSSPGPQRSAALARLGYKVMLVLDGDVTENDADVRAATEAGVDIVKWQDAALEDVIITVLPIAGLQELVELAANETSEEGVLAQVAVHLGVKSLNNLAVTEWIATHSEGAVRSALASAAKGAKAKGGKVESRSWFKREDRGERLAQIVVKHRPALVGSELALGLVRVKDFAHQAVREREA